MAEITNQDVINAIRGVYQAPNRVSDEQTRNRLNDVINALSGLSTTSKQDAIISALQDVATQTTLEQLQSKLEAIESKLNEQVIEDGASLTKLTGSYVRQSTAPRPDGQEGDTLYLWDTGDAFIHDGTDWREVV